MFSILKKNENGFNIVELKDDSSGTTAAVIPSYGAILHNFTVLQDGEPLNVIDSSFEDLSNVEAGGFKSCKLSPFVCRLNNGEYHFGEKDYRIEKFYLGNHAIHGLLYDAVFSVEELYADENHARLLLRHEYRAGDKGYPFNYDCLVTYELTNNNELKIHTRVVNKDEGHIPVSDGWHPYFTFGGKIDELQLEFQSKEIVEFDSDLLPTGKRMPYQEFGSLKLLGSAELDNCFVANFAECQPMLVLRDPLKKIQLEIIPDKSYPYLQIYTPPHRKSIAIENLSSAPDAFNNGMDLITLAPGGSASFQTTYKLTSLEQ
jgi:aldose 1-epimerase